MAFWLYALPVDTIKTRIEADKASVKGKTGHRFIRTNQRDKKQRKLLEPIQRFTYCVDERCLGL